MMLWFAVALLQAEQAPSTGSGQAPFTGSGQAECRARPAEVLVGERYRRKVPTRAKRLSGARAVRVIWPGQMMTMDYRPDRLNLRVNHRRLITAVSCG